MLHAAPRCYPWLRDSRGRKMTVEYDSAWGVHVSDEWTTQREESEKRSLQTGEPAGSGCASSPARAVTTAQEPLQQIDYNTPVADTNASGRSQGGQFAPGNKLGRGNPHAQRHYRYGQLFAEAVSDEDFKQIVRTVVKFAMAGDTTAAKIVLDRLMGRIPEAPRDGGFGPAEVAEALLDAREKIRASMTSLNPSNGET